MMNESVLRSRQIRNLFRRQSSPFHNQKLQYPLKTETQSKNEVVYTPKSFFRLDDKHRVL